MKALRLRSQLQAFAYLPCTLTAALLPACTSEQDEPIKPEASVQAIRGGAGLSSTFLGMDFLVTDAAGEAIPCGVGHVEATVTLKDGSGSSIPLGAGAFEIGCSQDAPEVALVVDNSGSQDGHLRELRTAAGKFAEAVTRNGGRVSITRVSTEATTTQPMTAELEPLTAALGAMHISNGWTALYDGIRLGNEALGGSSGPKIKQFASRTDFCAASPRRGIVVFTDGLENNSAGAYRTEQYPGDAINTKLDDLKQLNIQGVSTPIYTVGLGDKVDHQALTSLAHATGGRHAKIGKEGQIGEIFSALEEYVAPSYQLCAEVPRHHCGALEVNVDYVWRDGDREIHGSRSYPLNVDCPTAGDRGKVATVLLTLNNHGIPQGNAKALASSLVRWVSPVSDPNVLVVRDDDHHGEAPEDTELVAKLLNIAGFRTTFLAEPAAGLLESQLTGYDVVWFANPGYPMDDIASFIALRNFSGSGGGVVLQGDDMASSMGDAFSLSPLTHLTVKGNGTSHCGRAVDNDEYDTRYRVILSNEHPALAGLPARSEWLYGDDIDHTVALGEGEEVLVSADLVNKAGKKQLCAEQVPVITVFDPQHR